MTLPTCEFARTAIINRDYPHRGIAWVLGFSDENGVRQKLNQK